MAPDRIISRSFIFIFKYKLIFFFIKYLLFSVPKKKTKMDYFWDFSLALEMTKNNDIPLDFFIKGFLAALEMTLIKK